MIFSTLPSHRPFLTTHGKLANCKGITGKKIGFLWLAWAYLELGRWSDAYDYRKLCRRDGYLENWDFVWKKRWWMVVRQTTVQDINMCDSFVRLGWISRYSQTYLSPKRHALILNFDKSYEGFSYMNLLLVPQEALILGYFYIFEYHHYENH